MSIALHNGQVPAIDRHSIAAGALAPNRVAKLSTVGRSASALRRVAVLTASARSPPARMCSIDTAGMAIGMTLAIAMFALGAVLLRDGFMVLMEGTDSLRRQLGRGLEAASAVAIVAFGAWLPISR
jgi:hypothetical protein